MCAGVVGGGNGVIANLTVAAVVGCLTFVCGSLLVVAALLAFVLLAVSDHGFVALVVDLLIC